MPAGPLPSVSLADFATSAVIHSISAATYELYRNRGLFNETAVLVDATGKAQHLIAGSAASRERSIVGVFDGRLNRTPSGSRASP